MLQSGLPNLEGYHWQQLHDKCNPIGIVSVIRIKHHVSLLPLKVWLVDLFDMNRIMNLYSNKDNPLKSKESDLTYSLTVVISQFSGNTVDQMKEMSMMMWQLNKRIAGVRNSGKLIPESDVVIYH